MDTETSKKKQTQKPPTQTRRDRAPRFVLGFIARATRPGDGRSLVKDRQKMRRIGPEGKELLTRVAKQLGVTPEHGRSVALGDRRSDRISDAIAKEFEMLRQAGVSGNALVKKGKD